MKIRTVSIKEISRNGFNLSARFYLNEEHSICKCLKHIEKDDEKFIGTNNEIYCSKSCLEVFQGVDINE